MAAQAAKANRTKRPVSNSENTRSSTTIATATGKPQATRTATSTTIATSAGVRAAGVQKVVSALAPGGKSAATSATSIAVAGPRRVLGDLNANKSKVGASDRSSKDSTLSLKPARSRHTSQSSVSSLASTTTTTRSKLPSATATKSLSAATGKKISSHSRSASESHHVPGAPKIGSGIWNTEIEEESNQVEVLSNTNASAKVGLGISSSVEDEEMVCQEEEVEESGSSSQLTDLLPSPSPVEDAEHVVDPDNWMMLDPNEESEAQRELDELKREFREELDFWDTSMVAEYSEEIFAYMAQLEESTMPDPNYMNNQTEIDWNTRTTLIEWLMQVHMRYHMLPETLWIAINIIDRFLSNRTVSLVKLQLVGITAIFIAAKYEEIMAPSVEEFVFMSENGYTRDEILKGERIVLSSLEFNVSPYCTPYSWVRRISKADEYDIQTRTLSKFLMEVCLLDYRFIRAKPSMIAATGMYAARRMLGGEWDDAFTYYSGYTETQLNTALQFMIEGLTQTHFEERFLFKKYSTKKFLKASIFAVNWAKSLA